MEGAMQTTSTAGDGNELLHVEGKNASPSSVGFCGGIYSRVDIGSIHSRHDDVNRPGSSLGPSELDNGSGTCSAHAVGDIKLDETFDAMLSSDEVTDVLEELDLISSSASVQFDHSSEDSGQFIVFFGDSMIRSEEVADALRDLNSIPDIPVPQSSDIEMLRNGLVGCSPTYRCEGARAITIHARDVTIPANASGSSPVRVQSWLQSEKLVHAGQYIEIHDQNPGQPVHTQQHGGSATFHLPKKVAALAQVSTTIVLY
jgi:hypothetical protein